MTEQELIKISHEFPFSFIDVQNLYIEMPDKFKKEKEFRKVLKDLSPFGSEAIKILRTILYSDNARYKMAMQSLEEMKTKFNELYKKYGT